MQSPHYRRYDTYQTLCYHMLHSPKDDDDAGDGKSILYFRFREEHVAGMYMENSQCIHMFIITLCKRIIWWFRKVCVWKIFLMYAKRAIARVSRIIALRCIYISTFYIFIYIHIYTAPLNAWKRHDKYPNENYMSSTPRRVFMRFVRIISSLQWFCERDAAGYNIILSTDIFTTTWAPAPRVGVHGGIHFVTESHRENCQSAQ